MKKRILFLGAGIFQVPVIALAKKSGHYIITIDYLADSPGHRLADEKYILSTRHEEKCCQIARAASIDAVLTVASDVAVPTVAYIGQQLGLPAVNRRAAEILSHKGRFRNFLKTAGLNTPEFLLSDRYEELEDFFMAINKKCILKPLDSSGSKGVSAITGIQQLGQSFRALQNQFPGKVCLEEFIQGTEVGGDALFVDGRLEFIMITKKYLTPPPYYVPIGHIVPGDIYETKPHSAEAIGQKLQTIISLLGIVSSPVNFDVILDDQDRIFLIDIGLRSGGNCIPDIIRYACGMDLHQSLLDIALGISPQIGRQEAIRHVGSRILTSPKEGTLVHYEDPHQLKEQFENLLEVQYDFDLGAPVHCFTQGNFRIGHLIATGDCISSLERSMEEMEQFAGIRVA